MIRISWLASTLLAAMILAPSTAAAALSVEVWTQRGHDAVYQSGDNIQVTARTSDDAHLLIYEIDAEGFVNVLFPYTGNTDFVEGRRKLRVPDPASDLELVVEGPVGQGYIVAIASVEPFEPLPWYLRPYNAQAEEIGYHDAPDEEEGITAEGQIVGDPFVAMERIRRRIVTAPSDPEAFATAYTSYYLHHEVKYPRYLCYDCHRPGYWSWWAGFDPYYASCSAFTFRVNFSWYWGPSYWCGFVPYYVYECRPGFGWGGRSWFSGWYGWRNYCRIWGGPLIRYKSAVPAWYVPPHKYKYGSKNGRPPGLLSHHVTKRGGQQQGLPVGRNVRASDEGDRGGSRMVRNTGRNAERQPAREMTERGGRDDQARTVRDTRRSGISRKPAREVRGSSDETRLSDQVKTGARSMPSREMRRGRDDASGVRVIKSQRASRSPAVKRSSSQRSLRMVKRGSGSSRYGSSSRRLGSRQGSPSPSRNGVRAKAPRVAKAPKPAKSSGGKAVSPKPSSSKSSRSSGSARSGGSRGGGRAAGGRSGGGRGR